MTDSVDQPDDMAAGTTRQDPEEQTGTGEKNAPAPESRSDVEQLGEDGASAAEDRTERVREAVREVIEQRRKSREEAGAEHAIPPNGEADVAPVEDTATVSPDADEDTVAAEGAGPSPTSGIESDSGSPEAQAVAPALSVPDLSLMDAAVEGFSTGRDRLSGVLLERMAKGIPYVSAALDIAEYHLLHLLPEEALGFLDDTEGAALSAEEELRLASLRDIALLQRQPLSTPDLAVVGQDDHASWGDWAPWTLFSLAHEGKWEEAADLAGEAVGRTADYTDTLKRLLLPVVAEAVIRGGDETDAALVKPAVRELERISTRPAERTVLSWLMGLAAERSGEDEAAAAAWTEAAAGEGRHAQKARIALVDLGLASGKMTREEAEALLSEAHDLWRGDDLEVDLLMRLAILRESLGDLTGSVIALDHLASGFPELPVAEQARERMVPLLDRLYAREIDEEWPLSRWSASHNSLDHAFADDETFVPYREEHARAMLGAGLTAEAAREYAKLSLIAPEEERARYGLLHVESLLAGGDVRKAASVLSGIESGIPAPLEQDAERLWMRIAAEAGPGEDYTADRGEVGTDSLEDTILLGRLYWNDRNWEKVREVYGHLRAEYPERFGRDELLRYMLAAYRSGDADAFMTASLEHADMIESAEWREIAQSLISDPPAISPLGQEEAYRIIGQAEDVGGLVSRAIGMEGARDS